MILTESDILYERGRYWVCKNSKGKGFEIYRNTITHAERCAIIGYLGKEGFERAIKECDRRAEGEDVLERTFVNTGGATNER